MSQVVAVGEALVEVAFGQPGLPAHGPDGDGGPVRGAEQPHAGGDQIVTTTGLPVLQGNTGPTAATLTRGRRTPRLIF